MEREARKESVKLCVVAEPLDREMNAVVSNE